MVMPPLKALEARHKLEITLAVLWKNAQCGVSMAAQHNKPPEDDSDCLLKPVAIYPDPDRDSSYLVMTEVLNADGSPHISNGRATIDDDDEDFWFGFEQEYFLWDTKTNLPPGFPAGGYPAPQGPYYCSVGAANSFGRDCVEEHFDICLEAGNQTLKA